MLPNILLLTAGVLCLYYGAEWLVRGSSFVALDYGIRPGVVGLTIVALGTSMPEFLVNFFAVLEGESGLALGNIVGSNISNVGLILGASALLAPLTVSPKILRREYPVMLGTMGVFYLCALDGQIGEVDGLGMVILLVLLGSYYAYGAQRPAPLVVNEIEEEVQGSLSNVSGLKKVALLAGGTIGLGLGARLMVHGATKIAYSMGIEPVVVGLTVVAIGTSLPELAASLMSAKKQEPSMSLGNVLGSNLLNVLLVVGLISMIEPLDVERRAIRVDLPIMLGFCVLIYPLTWPNQQISRISGLVLLTGFMGYMTYLLLAYL